MAKQPQQNNSGATTFGVSITVPNKHLKDIDGIFPEIDSMNDKVARIAEGALLDLCEGGVMVQPPIVRKLQESFGGMVSQEIILEQFQRGVGRKNGKLQITVDLDPAYEGVVAEAANFQGKPINDVLQDAWNTAWDNGDFYDPRICAERVVMTIADKKELSQILGKDFTNGTELAALVKAYAVDHEGLFGEVTK